MISPETAIETLVQNAAIADKAGDALQFSQAACNVANVMRVLAEIEKIKKT